MKHKKFTLLFLLFLIYFSSKIGKDTPLQSCVGRQPNDKWGEELPSDTIVSEIYTLPPPFSVLVISSLKV